MDEGQREGSSRKLAVDLAFAQIQCQRCGVKRICGVRCPDCGARPAATEVDVAWQRRARLGQTLLSELEAPAALDETAPMPLDDFLMNVCELMDELQVALRLASDTNFHEIELLSGFLQRHRQFQGACRRLALGRPFSFPNRVARQIISGVDQVVRAYLKVLIARTPIEAQHLGFEVQRLLDALSAAAGSLNTWVGRHKALSEEHEGGVYPLVMADALEQSDALTLQELGSFGARELSVLLGEEVLDFGIGFAFALQKPMVDLFLDPYEFRSKVVKAVDLFSRGLHHLRPMLASPEFRDDLNRLELEIFDAAVQCEQTVAASLLSRQAVRSVVSFNQALVEAAGRLVAIPVLLALGLMAQPYEKLRQENATTLIDACRRDCEVSDLLAGFDTHLRNASAHSVITFSANNFSTQLRSGSVTYSNDEVVQSAFEGLESLLAVLLALRHTLVREGLSASWADDPSAFGFSNQQLVDLFVPALAGRSGTAAASLNGSVLGIECDFMDPGVVSPWVAGVLALLPEGRVTQVEVDGPDRQAWMIDVARFRAFSEASEEFDREVATVMLLAGWKDHDGNAWLPVESIRSWAASRSGEALSLELADTARRLRSIRDVAIHVGDVELQKALRSLVSAHRRQNTQVGVLPREAADEGLRKLAEWAANPVHLLSGR